VEDFGPRIGAAGDGDHDLAQYGIIYVDEIDITPTSGRMIGRDVSGRGVQTTLLKLMRRRRFHANPMDIQSADPSALEFRRKENQKRSINTRHILFICSGAFDRLRNRLIVGYGQRVSGLPANRRRASRDKFFGPPKPRISSNFGLEPELSVVFVCASSATNSMR